MRTTPVRYMLTVAITAAANAIAPAAVAATLSDQLSDFGHPNTKPCQLQNSSEGLGDLLVLQFQWRDESGDNEQEAVALLKLLAPALESAGQRYAGFDPRKDWTTCTNRNPKYVFWRDYDDNWRFVKGTPRRYFSGLLEDLAPEQRGTPAEAYVLFSLGLVEQRLGHIPRSIDQFERAYAILEATDDPNGIMAFVLAPLLHHYLREGEDQVKAQNYLNAYALVAESSTVEQGEYLPLVKVAPAYPRSAQLSGREGHVLLEFTVDADGRVHDPIVIEESPDGVFRDAAIAAALEFRYIPKVVDGKRVSVSGVRNLITFELAD